jgi:predicted HAD superfamily Cof-like phosphohydrolase
MEEIQTNIYEWSKLFGAPVEPNPIIPQKERVLLSLKLIAEEFAELMEETFDVPPEVVFSFLIENKKENKQQAQEILMSKMKTKQQIFNKFHSVIDSFGDLLWVTVRGMYEFGIEPQTCIQEIMNSNMSKLDYSKEDAKLTLEKYEKEGIENVRRWLRENK